MTVIPSTNALLQALFDYFSDSPEITEVAEISEKHPEKSGQILEGKARLVMSVLPMDQAIGRYQSKGIATPRLQFAFWAPTAFLAQHLKELVSNAVELMCYVNGHSAMSFAEQHVDSVRRLPGSGAVKDPSVNLFVASLDVDFFLNGIKE